jgi:hypothetical protein
VAQPVSVSILISQNTIEDKILSSKEGDFDFYDNMIIRYLLDEEDFDDNIFTSHAKRVVRKTNHTKKVIRKRSHTKKDVPKKGHNEKVVGTRYI